MSQTETGELPGTVVFDVCDTLYDSNTTFDFIRFVLEKENENSRFLLLKVLTFKFSPVFIGLQVWQKLAKQDLCKRFSISLLSGMDKRAIEKFSGLFFEQCLEKKKIARTHELMQGFKKNGARILLLSGSLEPVIAAIAQSWGVEYRASLLDFDKENRFTGRLKSDLTGRKLEVITGLNLPEESRLTVVTDNLSDIGLARAADKCYIVIKNKQAKALWKGLHPEFICLPTF